MCSKRGSEGRCDRSVDLGNSPIMSEKLQGVSEAYALLAPSGPQGGYRLVAVDVELRPRSFQAKRFVFSA